MPTIFDSIGDFFSSLFGGEDAQLKRELRKLEDEVTLIQPPIYQKTARRVLAALPASLTQLQKALLPLGDLFSKTISNPEPKIAGANFNYLIENLLTGDISTRRSNLTYETMKSRLMSCDNTDEELGLINAEFNKFIAEVKRQGTPNTMLPLQRLYTLSEWVLHSIEDFIKPFRPPPGGESGSVSVLGESLIDQLLDIYYVLKPVILDDPLEIALSLLFERINAQKAQAHIEIAQKMLDRARIIMAGTCHPDHLAKLVRVIQRDPNFEVAYDNGVRNFLQEYCTQTTEGFERDRDRAAGEVQENNLIKEVHTLFQDRPLKSVPGYDNEHNLELTAAGVQRFSYIKPMNILKSLNIYIMDAEIFPAIERVLTDAIYVEKDWATLLGNTFYLCKSLSQRFLDFEESLTGDGRATIEQLEKLIHRPQGGPNTAPANRIVEFINKSSAKFLIDEAKNLFLLSDYMKEILQDFKKPTPERISNIRVLGGKNNRQILQDIADGHEHIILFLKILKNFVVLNITGF